MYTQCPHCDAIFQLTTAQLKAANGEVRCGQCLTVFNALNHLSDDIPTKAAESAQKPTDGGGPDDLWTDENRPASSTKSTITEPATDNSEATVTDYGASLDTSPEITPIDSELETTIEAANDTAAEEALVETTSEAMASTGADATTNTKHTEPATEASDADIFSEIIAEANQHTLPTEAIDRFEEFLSDDTATPLHADTDTDADTDLDNEFSELANEFDTARAVSDEAPSADELNDTELNARAFAAPALGEMEMATAELDTELHIDTTEEFAEFAEYLQAADDPTDEKTNESIVSVSDESDESDESDSRVLDTADIETADSNTTVTTDADTGFGLGQDRENEFIIIEESDLDPINSASYADKPEAKPEDGSDIDIDIESNIDTIISTNADADADKRIDAAAEQSSALDDFSELEEAAAEVAMGSDSVSGEASAESSTLEPGIEPTTDETRQPGSEEIHNIPALILEDLHAAKAEQLRPSNTPWVIGSLLLMLTLVLQVVYYSRDELAKDASLRPWLIQMCQYVNCTLTQPYDIKQIDIIGREVRSHPSARKALIASTTLINNADFVQPFPLLTVVFSDINGKTLAQRRFTPREYLSNKVDLAAGMTPDLPLRIELELVDPGKDAVNYEFHAELDPRNTRPLT